MPSKRIPRSAFLYLFLGMALFGSATPVSKIVGDHFPPLVGSGFRVFAGTLVLIPFLFGKTAISKPDKKETVYLFLVAATGVVGFSLLLLYGMREASGVTGSMVLSLTPAATALASFIFLRERFGWQRTLGVSLSVGGVMLLTLAEESTGATTFRGILMMGAAVLCEVAYTLFGKKLTATQHPVGAAAVTGMIGAIMFVPLVMLQWNELEIKNVSTAGWASVIWWGIGAMGLGSVMWYKGVKLTEGSVAAGFMGVMPVSGVLLSYCILDEKFHWLHLAGMVVVLIGIGLITKESRTGKAASRKQ